MTSLIERAIRRSKRAARDLSDIQLRKQLTSRARPDRAPPSLDDLPGGVVLVVVAHPDDESIAAAGLMSRAQRVGVICASNGAPRKESYARKAGFDNWMAYAAARRAEALAALGELERPVSPCENLGITDQEVSLNLVPLTRYLTQPLRSGFSHVVTHAYEGGHPDHDAVAFAVHAACALIGRAGETPPTIVEAPLYHAAPGQFVHGEFAAHPDAGPATALQLTEAEQALKRRMFDRHVTQSQVFDDFTVASEPFRVAPRYHFAAPPHAGQIGYDTFGWVLTNKVWRREAWRAMRELDLLRELA